MGIASLSKVKGSRVMGIDASTNSIAYCILSDGKVEEYGEIYITGSDVYHRILDAKRKMRALNSRFKVDFVAIEAAIMVRSVNTGLKMAYVFGAIMGELMELGVVVKEVPPISWQSDINNKNLNKVEKEAIKKEFPGKTDSWYRNKSREIRKQKTIDFIAKEYGIKLESDNVADSIGIARYAWKHMISK